MDVGDQRLIIAGGGLAGALTALAVAHVRPEAPLLLLEQSETFGGNHIWSFFDADVLCEDRWLVDPIIARSWSGYDILFPKRRRTLPTGYNSVRSGLLDALVRERLRPDQYRLGAAIEAIEAGGVRLTSGETITGACAVDARGPRALAGLDLGWQKFMGREYRLSEPHGLSRPIVMDGTVDQCDGYRFIYILPFTEDRLLIEDTYYSTDPTLDRATIGRRIDEYVAARGWRFAALEHEEEGILPVAMGGDFDVFWPAADRSARIGLRGGLFHPTTGYSLPDAVRTALMVARSPEPALLPTLLRSEAKRLWKARSFYRLLNRMMFRAAAPDQRYRVLEHFYRLDPALIARFYSGRSRLSDRLKIVSGRPPVPIGRALRALWS